MENKQCFDAKFAYHLISSLKQMRKKDGKPFITNGVTLPFLAYACKRFNNDTSSVSVKDMLKIMDSLDNAAPNTFVFEVCSVIEERVIALYSDINAGYYHPRTEKSHLLCDDDALSPQQSLEDVCNLYEEVINVKTYSRVYKDYRYDWAELTDEEENAIQTIVESYLN